MSVVESHTSGIRVSVLKVGEAIDEVIKFDLMIRSISQALCKGSTSAVTIPATSAGADQ